MCESNRAAGDGFGRDSDGAYAPEPGGNEDTDPHARRLRGHGLNGGRGGPGDEYVKIKLVIPPKLTAKEKDRLEKLAPESRFNPRELLGANRHA